MKPMMGPVHEKLTSARVNAMMKMLSSPVVFSALRSALLLHDEGSCSSKNPMKLRPNTISSRAKKMLTTALVDSALAALAPKIRVTTAPSAM